MGGVKVQSVLKGIVDPTYWSAFRPLSCSVDVVSNRALFMHCDHKTQWLFWGASQMHVPQKWGNNMAEKSLFRREGYGLGCGKGLFISASHTVMGMYIWCMYVSRWIEQAVLSCDVLEKGAGQIWGSYGQCSASAWTLSICHLVWMTVTRTREKIRKMYASYGIISGYYTACSNPPACK